MSEPAAARRRLLLGAPAIGRWSRLRMSRREIYLALGHLFVVALALEDEEVAASLMETLRLGPVWLPTIETGLIFAILALQGLFTLGWVRCNGKER